MTKVVQLLISLCTERRNCVLVSLFGPSNIQMGSKVGTELGRGRLWRCAVSHAKICQLLKYRYLEKLSPSR